MSLLWSFMISGQGLLPEQIRWPAPLSARKHGAGLSVCAIWQTANRGPAENLKQTWPEQQEDAAIGPADQSRKEFPSQSMVRLPSRPHLPCPVETWIGHTAFISMIHRQCNRRFA
jgi:hypothetical protein